MQEQLETILDTYVCGNKSTARAMLNQIQYQQRFYAAMYLLAHAEEVGYYDEASVLIASVTT